MPTPSDRSDVRYDLLPERGLQLLLEGWGQRTPSETHPHVIWHKPDGDVLRIHPCPPPVDPQSTTGLS